MTERRRRALTREIPIAAPVDAVWKALTDAEELIERWEPNVQLRTAGLTGAWKGIVTDYHDAYVRIDTRCVGDIGTPLIWLSTYGMPPQAVRDIEQAWQASLDAAFSNQPV